MLMDLYSLDAYPSAVNEDTVGALQSFAINSATGGLTPISSTGSGGNGPAFAAPLSGGQVAIMNVCLQTSDVLPLSNLPFLR